MPQSMKKWEKVSEIRASGIFRIRKDILSNYLWTKLRNIIFITMLSVNAAKKNAAITIVFCSGWGEALVDLYGVRQLGYLFLPKWFKHFKLLSH